MPHESAGNRRARLKPDATDARLAGHLDAIRRRASTAQALAGFAWGCGAAVILAVLLLRSGQPRALAMAVSCLTVAAAIVATRIAGRQARSRGATARAVERHAPDCRNVVITAEELLRAPGDAPPWIVSRVFQDATARLEELRPSDVRSLRRVAVTSASAAIVLGALLLQVKPPGARLVRDVSLRVQQALAADTTTLRVTAVIEPPPYIGVSPVTLENPERLDVVQGSRIRLRVRGAVARVRYGTRTLPLGGAADARETELTVTDSGYLAIEKAGQRTEAGGPARLIAVTVTPDRSPDIRIEAPGRDLLLPDASGTIPVAAAASDDFGLRNLEIRYTRISGSGERFDFEEGTVSAAVTRNSDRQWSARATLDLSALRLQAGDSLVYRAIARDARPGDVGTASSDTFFIEIAGPGQVALEGFEMPPEGERYALSQQMIVLKIERLLARHRALTAEALREQVLTIAAEQRAVRGNFVFLMGGHVEDEEEEAEQSHEIQEGRLQTSARAEISAAITHMTHAEQALTAAQLPAALPSAKAAVEALQRAFGRNRYFLRTIPVRNRVDPSRRLSGELAEARDWRREAHRAEPDAEAQAARALLARLLDLAPRLERESVPAAAATALAEAALAIAPADPEWQQIAQRLQALSGPRPGEVEAEFRSVVKAVAANIGRRSPAAPPDTGAGSLRSAWAEARR